MKRFRLILVPRDVKIYAPKGIRTEGATKVKFENMVNALKSIEGIKQDTRYKSWPTFDDECYFVYETSEYILKFEINGGFKELPSKRCSKLAVKTAPHVPSKESFIEIIGIVEKIQKKLDFKIYSVEDHKVVSLNELMEKADR